MENKKSKYIFIVLTMLCVVLIVLSSVKDGLMNPLRNTIGYVLVPVQEGVNRLGFGIYDDIKNHKTLQAVEAENTALSDRVATLTEENNRLQQETYELARLRELYALDQQYMQYPKVAARIIAKDSENWFQVFRIDKGSKDGIRVDQNVMAGGGLVGIVTDVGLNYATVRSIIDDESRVSAMGLGSTDTCIVAGDLTLYENGRLRITDVKKDSTLQDGDKLVTSNISSKYLPGILIGYAADIAMDDRQLTKNGYLIPAADFNNLSEVLVVTQVKDDSFQDVNPGTDASPDTAPSAGTQTGTSAAQQGTETSAQTGADIAAGTAAAQTSSPAAEQPAQTQPAQTQAAQTQPAQTETQRPQQTSAAPAPEQTPAGNAPAGDQPVLPAQDAGADTPPPAETVAPPPAQ